MQVFSPLGCGNVFVACIIRETLASESIHVVCNVTGEATLHLYSQHVASRVIQYMINIINKC